jgi:hypothetical protein
VTNAGEKKLHAKFSASGSERWLNCPASIALSEKAPPQVDSVYAKEGTDAHAVLEVIMRNMMMGRTKEKDLARMLKLSWPTDMVRHGFETYNQIKALVPEGAELLCETRVALDFVEPGMFGTVDAAIVELFGVLWVIDYKYGAGRMVEPAENSQMIYYALGIAKKYDFNFERVRLAIVQPRIVHKDGFFRTWDMSIEDLMSWTGKFKAGVEACKDPFASLNPGRHCFFCPAQQICPAVEDRAYDEAQADFDDAPKQILFEDIYEGANDVLKQLNKTHSRKG